MFPDTHIDFNYDFYVLLREEHILGRVSGLDGKWTMLRLLNGVFQVLNESPGRKFYKLGLYWKLGWDSCYQQMEISKQLAKARIESLYRL
jgi:hypothetical protein